MTMSYTVYLHRVQIIVASNTWESDLKQMPAVDRDWLVGFPAARGRPDAPNRRYPVCQKVIYEKTHLLYIFFNVFFSAEQLPRSFLDCCSSKDSTPGSF